MAPRAPLTMDLPLATRHLAGGVLVIAVPNASAQVVSIVVAEGSGTASDPSDRGGLASLRARLGPARSTPAARDSLVRERGGESSILVGPDSIVSRYVVPAGELSLPLRLERDRLDARVSEDTLVGSLRAMTEAREHDPAARYRSALDGLVYSGFAPYSHDPDGSADELLAIRNDAVAGTLASRPARPIVVVITGAIDPEAALLAADRELAGVAARPASALSSTLPDQTNQREAALSDPHAATSTLWVGFAIPNAAEADAPALEVAAAILANAPRSRLERALIDDGVARAANAELELRQGHSELRIRVDLAPGADLVRAREVTERTLLELGKSAPPPGEVERAAAWLASERVRELSDPASLAAEVANMALHDPAQFAGPKGAVRADLDRWLTMNGDAVARATSTHLSPIRRNVLEVRAEHPVDAPTGASLPRPAPPRAHGGSKPASQPAPAGANKHGAHAKPNAKPVGPPKGPPKPGAKPPHEPRPAKKRGKP